MPGIVGSAAVSRARATSIDVPDGDRWNNNIQLYGVVLDALPPGARRVLDAGCGEGTLVRRLAAAVPEAVGLDRDAASLDQARAQGGGGRYVLGDLLAPPFPPGSFDAVSTVTTLHHVGTGPGLAAMAALVRPGGVLAAVGVARARYPRDLPRDAAASVAVRLRRERWRNLWETPAPKVWPPDDDFRTTRRVVEAALPGARFRRHLCWRWSVTWRKPGP